MPQLTLRTLGFPEIHIDGRPSGPGLRKAVALLTYLAEAKGPVAREALATLLWPEAERETGRARLRRLLHRTEVELGQPVFDADRISIRWAKSVHLSLDSGHFESACDGGDFEEACRTYRGDFLAGFSLADSVEFDDWVFFRREALRGRLIHALERLVACKNAAGQHYAAAVFANRLVELDPLSEVYARHLIRSYLLAGDRRAAERHFLAMNARLRDEIGVGPDAETQALMRSGAEPAGHQPTRYARGAGIHLAFQTHGDGEPDILVMPGFVSSVERLWELPACRIFLASLMTMGRLILFDPRGTGLSDRIGYPPCLDAMVEDMGVILQAVNSRRVVLFGASQCGAACIEFAARHPGRTAGLILVGALAKGCWAPDYPFALRASQFDRWCERLIAKWGGPVGIETFGPSLCGDLAARSWWAGLLRAASSPGALKAVLDAMRDVDVRPLLPQVSVPTMVLHRRHDRAVRIDAGRFIASHISGAQFIELDGDDHWFFAGRQEPVLEAVRRFLADVKIGRAKGPSTNGV